jgi:hypothetical protein
MHMSETVTLTLPDAVAQSARAVAERTHRRMEDVLVDWLDRLAIDLPVDALPDDQLLALRDLRMSDEQQEELSALLALQREQALGAAERLRLDDLMAIYRRGMVRKARAVQVAVDRGLQPPLT